MSDARSSAPGDALDALTDANETLAMLLKKWADDTDRLDESDDVDVRWERGSAVKMALQHMAVREAAKRAVCARVADLDTELAERLEGDGETRRKLIAALDEVARGREAITLNGSPIDEAMARVRHMVLSEMGTEHDDVLPAVRQLLGSREERDLPSQRRVQMTSETHPGPGPRWYDRVWPVKAAKALYDHLRTSPSGGTAPSLDSAREHMPGPGE